MSTALAQQQTDLLDALQLNTPELIANYSYAAGDNALKSLKKSTQLLRGLRAYRANAQVLCASALQASYPVLQQLLGEENFSHLAQDFWQAMPPERGDLAQWGGALASYLIQVPQLQALLQDAPYLIDVACVEWALHVAATATDAELDASSFQLLASYDPAKLRLVLSPGCAIVRSAYPVVAFVQLHDARASNMHDAARTSIALSEPQTALIWRQGYRPMFQSADAASAALIEATLQGHGLAAALDAALAQEGGFDLEAWFAASVQAGLLLGAAQI